MTNCLTWAAYLTWPDGHFRLAPTPNALSSGPVGNLTQWDFHEVQEHPNRSSNEGDMTFRSWRSCVVNFDEHCSWTTPVGRPLFMDDPCSWTTTVHGRPLFDDHCSWMTPFGRPLFMDDHCSWTTPVGRPLFDDYCSWTTPVGRPLFMDDPCSWTTTIHGRPLFMDDHCSWTTPVGRPLFDDHCSWTTPIGRPFAHLTVQSKKTITWPTRVQIEKFKSLTSISLMGLQFIIRIHFQIPFI